MNLLTLKMEENKEHLQHIMLFYFKKIKNVTQMQEKKQILVHRQSLVNNRMCQKWFAKFRARDFLLKDALHSSKLVQIDSID